MCIALSNAHARATVLSAVWSPPDQQLVAVLLAATEKLSLTALKAELEKNNKNSLVALSGDVRVELSGAKRGYIHHGASLEKVHAQGHLLALLHWRAHDPRLAVMPAREDAAPAPEDFFYVVARPGDCLPTLFLERLQLALAWPLQPNWAEPLLRLGLETELIEHLPVRSAEQSNCFQAALRVVASEERWGAVLSDALAQHTLTF